MLPGYQELETTNMTESEQYHLQQIKCNLETKVIRLEVYEDDQDKFGSNRFYTLWSHENDCYSYDSSVNVVPDTSDEEIAMWDIFSESYVTHHISDIGQMTVFVNDDGSYDHDRTTTLINAMYDEIECCDQCKYTHCNKKELQDIMLHTRTNVSDVDVFMTWDLLRAVDFKFKTIHDLQLAENNDMTVVCEGYLNYMRSKRTHAFEELDQLEKEVKDSDGTPEDLDDIDTIKQMFRDIPQDFDPSLYKSVDKLLEYWPSLLTPKPDNALLVSTFKGGDNLYELLKVDEEMIRKNTPDTEYTLVTPPSGEYTEIVDHTYIDDTIRMIKSINEIDVLQEMIDACKAAGFVNESDLTDQQIEDIRTGASDIKIVNKFLIDAILQQIDELKK